MPGSARHQVAVVGAAGHTGSFVVSELVRRGFSPIAIGRDRNRLAHRFSADGVPVRAASLDDRAAMDQALAGSAAVINCAGPFLDTADAVASAAIRARIHYLDVTAEQPSAQATLDGFGSLARDCGVVCIPAMGFYGGLSDLLATVAAGDWPVVDDVLVAIALDSWHPTRGTRLTGQRNTAPRVVIRDGRLAPLPDPAPTLEWDFPGPWRHQPMTAVAFTEVPLIARHLRVTNETTYLNDLALRDVTNPATPAPQASDESGRSAQRFAVEVRARAGDRTRLARATGRDIYAVTAPLVVEAAAQLLSRPAGAGGAFAPGEILDSPAALRALEPAHLSFELIDVPAGR